MATPINNTLPIKKPANTPLIKFPSNSFSGVNSSQGDGFFGGTGTLQQQNGPSIMQSPSMYTKPAVPIVNNQIQTKPETTIPPATKGPVFNPGLPLARAATSNPNPSNANDITSGQWKGYTATPDGYQPTQNTVPVNTPAPNSGLVPPPTFAGSVGSLVDLSKTKSPEYIAAANQYQRANADLQALKTAAANNQFIGAGTNVAEYAGTQGLLANRLANQENALTGEMNAAADILGKETGQQQTQQSGLSTAAGLVSPQLTGPTTVPFNPASGTYGQPAASAYGGNGLQGVGNVQAQLNIGQNVGQMNAALGAAQSVGGNLSKLITDNNINPTNPQFLNSLNQFLQTGVMSNPKYQQFYGTLNDYIASLAPILGVGGNITDQKTNMAAQMVNQLASGSSIVDTIGYFDKLAQDKIQGYSSGPSNNPPTTATGGSNTLFSPNNFYGR